MSRQQPSLFDSYDIFGKTIPGILLIILFVGLLPYDSRIMNAAIDEISNFESLAVIGLGSIVFGLILGEAVHRLAIDIERIADWLQNRLIKLREKISDTISFVLNWIREVRQTEPSTSSEQNREQEDQVEEAENQDSECKDNSINRVVQLARNKLEKAGLTKDEGTVSESRLNIMFPSTWYCYGKSWVGTRADSIERGLSSHRELFERILTKYVNPQGPPKSMLVPKEQLEIFLDRLSENFEISSDDLNSKLQEDSDWRKTLYVTVSTELAKEGAGKANSYQARYSFCRSMWVVTGGFFVAYFLLSIVLFHEQIISFFQIEFISGASRVYVILSILTSIVFVGTFIEKILKAYVPNIAYNSSFLAYPLLLCYGIITIIWLCVDSNGRRVFEFVFTSIAYLAVFIITNITNVITLFFVSSSIEDMVFFKVLEGAIPHSLLFLAGAAALFFMAAASYKDNYIEYLISEYIQYSNSANSNNDE